jgi:hypothetical protein
MSEIEGAVLEDAPRAPDRPGGWHAVRDLAVDEAFRMVRHPASLVGAALFLGLPWVEGAADGTGQLAYSELGEGLTMYYGVAAYFAAHRCASRARRAGAGEWLEPLPMTPARQTGAFCLACLGPFAAACLGLAVAYTLVEQVDLVVLEPGLWRLLGSAVTVLAGCLLGVMVSRWLPVAGAPLLVMTGLVATCVLLQEVPLVLSPYTDWVGWPNTVLAEPYVTQGSPGWHVAYLVGLGGMAAAGSFVVHPPVRHWALLGGLAALAVTVAAGLLQLP